MLIHEASIGPLTMEHPVVADFGASIEAPELMVGKVSKLVQLKLVRLVHCVHLVNMFHILLEHIEPLVLVLKAPRHSVVAPPPLVEVPQALLGF